LVNNSRGNPKEKGSSVLSEPIHIISLGAGVQSSTMALMAALVVVSRRLSAQSQRELSWCCYRRTAECLAVLR
jgi:hypothetical protein